MGESGYVVAGYLLTAVVLGGYAWHLRRRIRLVSRTRDGAAGSDTSREAVP